jgi:hypothetical protein
MPAFFINHPPRRGKVERCSFKIELSPTSCLNIGVFWKIHERRGEKVGCLASLKISQGSERILVRKMDQAIPAQYEV